MYLNFTNKERADIVQIIVSILSITIEILRTISG